MIILDIETKPDKNLVALFEQSITPRANLKDPEKIQADIEQKKREAVKKMSVDQDFSEIACIGVKIDDDPAKLIDLQELARLLNSHHTIVTFNGKKFDIPVIIKNFVKKGIPFNGFSTQSLIKKWSTDKHIDLMELISCNSDYKSLDTYLQIYLGIAKTPIDFESCTQKELEDHCREDVENTYKLYKLFEGKLI